MTASAAGKRPGSSEVPLDGSAASGSAGSALARTLFAIAVALGLAIAPVLASAQARANLPRIGILSFGTAPSGANPDPATGFDQGLRELGYVEGQNILIERRYADGQPGRLPALAAELVQLKLDVILTGGPGPLEAARKATTTIPIVTVSGSDPIRSGWAQSLAHPGGNVTGLTVTFPELGPKHIELLKQTFPDTARVTVLMEFEASEDFRLELQATARRLGLQLQMLDVKGSADIDAAFVLARQQRAQAIYAIATNVVVTHREQIVELAASNRLPSISEFPLMAQAGFLITYGADLDALGRRAIVYMDKILKGAKPGDLAIERPAKFQLIVNLKTAKALGIKLPQSLLLRADEVIE